MKYWRSYAQLGLARFLLFGFTPITQLMNAWDIFARKVQSSLEYGMEIILEMAVEIRTRLTKCPHYSSCLMQEEKYSSHTGSPSCAHCPSNHQEVIKENKVG